MAIRAIETGFEGAYYWYGDELNTETLHENDCAEVINILEMFSALKYSYDFLEDKSGIDQKSIEFLGFSGNDETLYMLFAQFMRDEGKWDLLKWDHGGNSHVPLLPRYSKMIEVWDDLGRKPHLSKDDLLKVVNA